MINRLLLDFRLGLHGRLQFADCGRHSRQFDTGHLPAYASTAHTLTNLRAADFI